MKEIVIITAHCSDHQREKTLRDLVRSVKNEGYEILVIAHTPISQDIQQEVEFFIYDRENRILTEPQYLPQPWFTPNNDRRIQSSLVGLARSSHLATWKMVSIALPFVKSLGYEIAHLLEYDSYIENFSEFRDNKKLLQENDAVIYENDKNYNGNWIDPILLGNYICLKTSSIPDLFLQYNEEKILEKIEQHPSKCCEKMFEEELSSKNVVKKKASTSIMIGNQLQLSEKWSEDYHPWAIPFFDKIDGRMYFIFWNQKDREIEAVASTDKRTFKIKVQPGMWHLLDMGDFNDVEMFSCFVDGKLRSFFDFSTYDREIFKKLSWRCETNDG
jgi:hypothetical protein